MDALVVVAVALVMAAGLLGTVVPLLPGLPLIWVAGLVYGIVAGFGRGGWVAFGAMTALLVAGTLAGYVLPHRAGRRGGAPRATLAVAIVAGIVGFFVVPVIGLPLGALLGVLVAERSRLGDWSRAWVTTRAVLTGFGVGVLVEVAAGVLMVGCWVGWVLLDLRS